MSELEVLKLVLAREILRAHKEANHASQCKARVERLREEVTSTAALYAKATQEANTYAAEVKVLTQKLATLKEESKAKAKPKEETKEGAKGDANTEKKSEEVKKLEEALAAANNKIAELHRSVLQEKALLEGAQSTMRRFEVENEALKREANKTRADILEKDAEIRRLNAALFKATSPLYAPDRSPERAAELEAVEKRLKQLEVAARDKVAIGAKPVVRRECTPAGPPPPGKSPEEAPGEAPEESQEKCFLDELIEDSMKKDPEFPQKMSEAYDRRKKTQGKETPLEHHTSCPTEDPYSLARCDCEDPCPE